MDLIDLLQWPAMLATVTAAWLIGSLNLRQRTVGFWCFLLSNLLWVAWGAHTGATALVVMQFCLAGLNIRAARKAVLAAREAAIGAAGGEMGRDFEPRV